MSLADILGTVGYALDTPGAYTRGLLAGKPGKRASGRDVLRLGPNKPGLDAGDIGGFAAEMALDPLNWIGGWAIKKGVQGLSAALKARKAATAAGSVAPEVASALAPAVASEVAPVLQQALLPAATTAVKTMGPTAGQQIARNMFEVGGEPVFHSRLANALEKVEPNRRIETFGDLLKAGEKGGGASRGEMELLAEKVGVREGRLGGRISAFSGDHPLEGFHKLSPEEGITAKSLLEKMKADPPLSLEERIASKSTDVSPGYETYNPPGGDNYREVALYPRPGVGDNPVNTTLLNASKGNPIDHMAHLTKDDPKSALLFMLMKDRELVSGGKAVSVEQLQSDLIARLENGGRSAVIPEKILADVKRRYPDIGMARAVRMAADEGKEGVMWHPGDTVRNATFGQESGQNAFYGKGIEPGGRMYDAARKLEKQIPGAKLEVVDIVNTSPRLGKHPRVFIHNHLQDIKVGSDTPNTWTSLKNIDEALSRNTKGKMSLNPELGELKKYGERLDEFGGDQNMLDDMGGMQGYEDAFTALDKKIYERPFEIKPDVRSAILEVMGKAAKETDKRWLLRLSPEAREAVKKMTFPLLGTAGIAVPMTARLSQSGVQREDGR
jgi:hypothetical protein